MLITTCIVHGLHRLRDRVSRIFDGENDHIADGNEQASSVAAISRYRSAIPSLR